MMLSQGKLKRTLCVVFTLFLAVSTVLVLRADFFEWPRSIRDPEPQPPPKPIYKPKPDPAPPIVDSFPLAATAKTPSDLPPKPTWNTPPEPHVPEKTPLFIGFTRNWPLLQQVVVSYITAGWPPEDINVVDNTGTMYSNRDGLLTLQNPFYIDQHRLTKAFGVNVITTPTLLTFAQLQNFYVFTALNKEWDHYFWAHMDTVVVSDESPDVSPYKSLYMRAVSVLRETLNPSYGSLATRWFAYDRLALVRTQAFVDVGGWDTMIPFYMTDCDMHERLWMRNFTIEDASAGLVYDVGSSLNDLQQLYLRDSTSPSSNPAEPPSRDSSAYHSLLSTLEEMQRNKNEDKNGRNTWQAQQRGGQGEPFYRDAEGFNKGIEMTMDLGRRVFEEKWGRGRCDIRDAGMVEGDAWRVIGEWENEDVQKKYWKEMKEKAKQEAKTLA